MNRAVSVRPLGLIAGAVAAASLLGCNPKPDTGVTVREGVGVRSYYTVRGMGDGAVAERDVAPTPRPREAITSDDYFGLKLEHIYAGGMLGREVGNIALVAEIGGIIPDGVSCDVIPFEEMGISPPSSSRSNHQADPSCAFKTVVQINPVFENGHATFDSVFISPPFRTGNTPLSLKFTMAQLNDVELAREIMSWVEEQYNDLSETDVLDLNSWQRQMVDVGFTAVNYMLDYAAEPTYVFDFQTNFVPVETVEGETRQNLLMGGDFVIVGLTDTTTVDGAIAASRRLQFSSGRLYWRDSGDEYTESPYMVFKVVRFSRFPEELPVQLARINRAVRRGMSAEDVSNDARGMILDLQDARVLNETEGAMMLDVFEWFADAATINARFEEGDDAYGTDDIPMQWADVRPSVIAPILPLRDMNDTVDLMRQLDERLFDNYGQTPGFRQDECITIRSLTQDLADQYRSQLPDVQRAVEDFQLARAGCQASPDDACQAMIQIEPSIVDMLESLPEALPEPECPQLRQTYTTD